MDVKATMATKAEMRAFFMAISSGCWVVFRTLQFVRLFSHPDRRSVVSGGTGLRNSGNFFE
jgi:hypothetical protein